MFGEASPVAIQLTPRRFTAAEYHQMIGAGVFDHDERLELIDGEIVQMSPIGDRHAACVRRLNELLGQLCFGRAIVDVQDPIVVGAEYAPQPDLALLRLRADYYAAHTPTAIDCLLVIEVAETSAEFDRQIKMPRYAPLEKRREDWVRRITEGLEEFQQRFAGFDPKRLPENEAFVSTA